MGELYLTNRLHVFLVLILCSLLNKRNIEQENSEDNNTKDCY